MNDGSVDGTADLIKEYGRKQPCIRLLENPGNRGKGYAVRHGMLAGRGDWILMTDADLSTPIQELDRLLNIAQQQDAAIVIGSRALDRSLVAVHQSFFREFSGRAFNLLMRWITGLHLADTQCGFKLYRRDAAQSVFSRQILDGFSFDVEDLVIAAELDLRVVEAPVRWANVEGTKVRLSQGLKSFWDLVLIRWYQSSARYRGE